MEQPLYHYNPIKAVPRPKINPYGKARCLTIDQARAFLHSIPRWTLQGKRDYALFLAYLATGRRNSEIRTLQFKDFEIKSSVLTAKCFPTERPAFYAGAQAKDLKKYREGNSDAVVFYRWRGKGSQRQDYCPPPVWSAILDSLKTSNRLESISPSEYIFIPLNNNARHLPNVRGSNTSQSPSPPRWSTASLKKYLRRAGIDPTHITVHSLRHTAALLRKEAGDDLHAISSFLGHSNLSITQIYLHKIENHQDASWLKVESLLGLS